MKTLIRAFGMRPLRVRSFWADDAGQTLVEYSLLLVFMLLVVIGLAINFQQSINGVNSTTNSNLTTASRAVN